jgi:hypothetical protein
MRSENPGGGRKIAGGSEEPMSKNPPVSEVFRKDMKPRSEDPYRARKKHSANTKCPSCDLLFHKGVWKWAKAGSHQALRWKLCPACLQIKHAYPGGVLKLSGSFLVGHHGDILRRIENLAKEIVKEHPLERIMKMEEKNGEIFIYATSEHLVARLGKAIRRDFKGELVLKYARDDKYATAHWRREA